ncbi:LuxR family transcriptional regulator [Streptomyces sp. NPDC127112]|uniref:LuxR family transcriptional regulator n=1 Tax=Streptomyces sp. NPDC127112 TaxID=3345364 RepID=UPI00363283D4
MVIRKTESVDDEVGRALLEVQGLIEAAKGDRSRTGPDHSVRMLESGEDVLGIFGHLMEKARRSVGVTVQRADSEAAAVALELLGHGRAPGAVRGALRGGVRVRLLCSPAVVRAPAFREVLADGSGCVVRVAECALNEAVLTDDSMALVWLGGEGADRSVSLVQDPASVSALAGLFGAVWNGARVGEESAGRARSATGQRILEALRDGRTDEAAARELAIPLRTYRRYVAEIMREMDASSRFQAGARAVRLGLLKNDE